MINKKLLTRLIIAFVIWITALFLNDYPIIQLVAYIISYLICGYDVLFGAIKNIFRGNFLDELFLMLIASIGAFLLKEYEEAVAIVLFFQIGEMFQGYAVEKSRDTIMSTMNLSVIICHKEDGTDCDPLYVNIGEVILVRPGEMIPLDGIALSNGTINCASLTGEAKDIDVYEGYEILSGSINTNTPIKVKVTKEYYDSTAAKIIDMVENATMKKAKSEKFITKFARFYTPIVVGLAFLLAFIPPIFLGFNEHFSIWSYRALSFLVVSCPCALVISVPLSYFAGIGAGAKKKIIIKGGSFLEDLSLVNNIVMDKTGTLTHAKLHIKNIITNEDKSEILKIAKGLEINSNHPVARAISENDIIPYEFEITEEPGFGIVGIKDGKTYYCGNRRLLEKNGIAVALEEVSGTLLYLACETKLLALIVLEDTVKSEAKESIDNLNAMNKNIIVLSGDMNSEVISTCEELGIKNYYSELLPSDKVAKLENIISSTKSKTMYIGDGINDAPVLALADVGVSMGQIGSDAAIEASDVVILNDDLNAIPTMLKIAKKTKIIVFENIIISIGIKVVVLLLSALGLAGIELAIFADVGVCVIAVLNAMRALHIKK